jgi:hypothetical protein
VFTLCLSCSVAKHTFTCLTFVPHSSPPSLLLYTTLVLFSPTRSTWSIRAGSSFLVTRLGSLWVASPWPSSKYHNCMRDGTLPLTRSACRVGTLCMVTVKIFPRLLQDAQATTRPQIGILSKGASRSSPMKPSSRTAR